MKAIRKDSETVIIRNEIVERYLKDIKNTKSLTHEEEHALLTRAKAGDIKARHDIVKANLKFVVVVAKEYQVKGFDIGDLINAGNVGLIEAIDKYQLTNKVKFISYAVWWIRNNIIEHIKEYGNTVRIPFNKQGNIEEYIQKKEKLEQQMEASLTADQVFELCDMELSDDLRSALMCSQTTSSLDHPFDDSEGSDTLGETISGEFIDPLQDEYKTEKRKALELAITKLTPTQQKVITLAFGLDDQISRSNEDIAEQLDLTAERVRQVREIALSRLRQFSGNKLKNFL